MLRMFGKYGMDIRKTPILVYPTLHYQNGGLDIGPDCQTPHVPNLYVAGGGGGRHSREKPAHGQQPLGYHRLWPGCRPECGQCGQEREAGRAHARHVAAFAEQLELAGISTGKVSPKLLPTYNSMGKDF